MDLRLRDPRRRGDSKLPVKTLLPLIALLAFCAAGSAQELFVTFEDVPAGTTDSAINMGTISKTNGSAVTFSWSGSAGRVSVENWNGSFGLLRPVTFDSTGTLVGNEVSGTAGNEVIRYVILGAPSSESADNSIETYWDDLLVGWTDSTYPLGL